MENITIRLQSKKVILYIAIFTWMILVFYFSSQDGEQSSGTSSYIVNLITKLYESVTNKQISLENVDKITYFVRKLAHFTLYFLGSIPIFLLFLSYNVTGNKLFIYTILSCAVYACTDELHQVFISDRNANILDVFIDTCGGMVGICITELTINILENKKYMTK